METTINTLVVWDEKIFTEQKKNFSNNIDEEKNDITINTEKEFGLKECKDIGGKKKWGKNCPNCDSEIYYSNEEGLRRSIRDDRSCLKCGSRKMSGYIGKKFGTLTIVNQYNSFSPCGSKIVKVDYKCDCGHIGLNKRFGCVKRQKMCLLCRNQNKFKIKEVGKSAFNKLYNDYKKRADTKPCAFELTKDDFEFLTKQDCFYCGEHPKNVKKARGNKEIYVYNGIDRVDNNEGYTKENSVSCCALCNRFKMTLSVNNFLEHVEKNI
jgi:hypothetical protein